MYILISKIEISKLDKTLRLAIDYASIITLHPALLKITNCSRNIIGFIIINGLSYTISINKEYLVEKILEILILLLIENKIITSIYEKSLTYRDRYFLENIVLNDILPFNITIKMLTWFKNNYISIHENIINNINYNPLNIKRKQQVQNYYTNFSM